MNFSLLTISSSLACIDECDEIMDKVGLPRGLIRYASEDEIVNKEKFKVTTRMKGYITVLIILVVMLIGLLFMRNDVEATVLRLPGQLFEHKGENISNIFTYKIVNKTVRDFDSVYFKLATPKGTVKMVGNPYIKIKKEGLVQGTLFIEINPAFLEGDKTRVKIEIYNNKELIETTKTNFLGPRSFN